MMGNKIRTRMNDKAQRDGRPLVEP